MSRALKSIKRNKTAGCDKISVRLLKDSIGVIFPSLVYLFNLPVSQGVFPRNWKLANVIPTHKLGSMTVAEDFRPVSPLPIIIAEK